MTQMDKVTQGNASSAEQTSSAAEELNSQALLLRENVDRLQEIIETTSRSDATGVDAVGRPPRASGQRLQSRSSSRHDVSDRRAAALRRPERAIVMPEEGQAGADGDDSHFRNF
jgi:methyl-accepting chemotaxis protein